MKVITVLCAELLLSIALVDPVEARSDKIVTDRFKHALDTTRSSGRYATVAQAEPAGDQMFLAMHSGHAGAAEIVKANYVDGERITLIAIESAKSASYWPSGRLELRNNLCVAQIMRGDNENARETCDRAVAQAKSLLPKFRQTRYKLRSVRAIAFSNRGVLRLLNSDMGGAKADFKAALRLRPELDNAIQNLNAMDSINRDRSVAQVNVVKAQRR